MSSTGSVKWQYIAGKAAQSSEIQVLAYKSKTVYHRVYYFSPMKYKAFRNNER